MRFRSSNFAMMSSPVRAIRAPSLNPAVSSGVLPAKLWLCPVDTPEVAPNMKAMRTHLLHRSTRIVTAYDLPFLFTFFRPYFRSAERRSEEHTSELQSLRHLVCRLLLEKKK